MRPLPEFVRAAGRKYEIIIVRRVVFRGEELECVAYYHTRQMKVSAAVPVPLQRRAVARTIRQLRRMASPHWTPAA
jgi:hypothetical protein